MRCTTWRTGVVKAAVALCAGVLLLGNCAAVSAGPWQVLYDQGDTSEPGGITAARALALSGDDKTVYSGWIQWEQGTVRQHDAQAVGPILNSYGLASIQATALATDDRGNVYIGYGLNGNGQIEIRNAKLATQVAAPFDGGRTGYVHGLSVWRSGPTDYYLYASRADGTIQRFNVTDPSAPALDTGWATGGTYAIPGAGNLRGIEAASDGTLYVAQRDTAGGDRKGVVYAIDPTLTFLFSTSVDGAMDVAVHGLKLYVSQYLGPDSAVAVLDTETLALLDTLHTGFEKDIDNPSHGYTGIDVAADGSLYLADEWYSTAGEERDRILTTFASAPPETGSLEVTLAPPEAAAAGGKWRVDNGAWQDSGATLSGLAVGTHAVDYKAVTGWTSPPRQWVTIAASDTATVTATYTQEPPGSLRVTLGPPAAVVAGARWRLVGGAWQKSGATLSGLMPGNHALGYKAVPGWIAPPSEWVSIATGQTTALSRNYTPVAGRRITGFVKDASGKGIADVSVFARTAKGDPGQANTGPDGTFEITGLSPAKFTVTPLLVGEVFSPTNKVVNLAKIDAVGITFIGKPDPKAFRIYGYAWDTLGNPISGVLVSFTGNLRAVRTNPKGYYEASGATDGATYTVSAAAKNLTFILPSVDVPISGSSQRVDFHSTGSTGPAVTLQSITIQGPAWVNGGSSADYDCTAKYSDNTTEPVDPVWTAKSTAATIDGTGKLTANPVAKNTPCTVTAKFSDGGVTKTAVKAVTIVPAGIAGAAARLAAIEAKDDTNPGRSSTTELQMVCAPASTRNATLTAQKVKDDDGLPWASGEPKWTGGGLGSLSGETVAWSGGGAANLNASAGGNKRPVSVKLFNPQQSNQTLSTKTKNVGTFIDILRKVARYTGADPAKSITWNLNGGLTTAMVDKFNDPLCGRKWIASFGGEAKMAGKTSLPSPRIKLGSIATIGPYFNSAVTMSYGITEAGCDPSKASPWIAVADHVTLGGTLALGAEAVTQTRDKAFHVDVTGTASAAVAGALSLEAKDAPPVLTGQATVAAADLPVEATVTLYGREIYTYSKTWHLWDAASIPDAPGILFNFATIAPKN